MKVWTLWNGGANYRPSELPGELEIFPSITQAAGALEDRARLGHTFPQLFQYADGRTESALTPCADVDPMMIVYLSDPRGDHDPYPDRIITIGPRGGVRVERV